jgi:Flp pilus assembly protein TadD
LNRATLLTQIGRPVEAVVDYKTAVAINPLSHEAYNALATIYLKDLDKHAAEIEHLYRQGVQLFPEDSDLWNNLGYFYTQRNQWPQAYEAYRQAILAHPDFELGWRNMQAIAAHVPDRSNDPILNQVTILHKADTLIQNSKWTEALAVLQPLADVLPKSYRVHFFQGNCFYGMDRYADAAKAFSETVALKPDMTAAWQNLAVSYERLQQLPQARAAFERLIQLEPNNAAIKQHLAAMPK